MKKILFVIFLLTTVLTFQPAHVFAVDNKAQPNGITNCFDYYHFQSVQTIIVAENHNISAGDKITFSGKINNQNNYPIVSGTLYVKIMRSAGFSMANGFDVVDQFVAKENVIIPANGSTNVSFPWKVPVATTSGTYKLVSYFVVDNKFNLLGLSFTDDITGNISEFIVAGQKNNVQFDKAGVVVNKNPYGVASFAPMIPNKEAADVSLKIKNTTAEDENVKVDYSLYEWDSMNPANFVRTTSQNVNVKANSTATTEITINDNTASVYYLIATLNYKDSKSIVGIRFVRPENNRLRLNFPSINNFPIKKGENSTVFSCFHNGSASVQPVNGKLELQVLDSLGKVVSNFTYAGPISGAMTAAKKDFVSKTTLDHFYVLAKLYDGNKLVDQSKLEYDCQKIDPKTCNPKPNVWVYVILVIIILLAIIIPRVISAKKKVVENEV